MNRNSKTKKKAREKIEKIERALQNLSPHETECGLCPRQCGVNRQKGEKGFCEGNSKASLSHAIIHLGEEPVLSGYHDFRREKSNTLAARGGSGTMFFSNCNLKCLFCQNYQLSWQNRGNTVSDAQLAEKMLHLQKQGALNINLVSPTHFILPILKSLEIAYARGLNLPLVYNSNAYENVEVIKNLRGIVDIYLPDLKFFSSKLANKLSQAGDYFYHASMVIKEMASQQPALVLNSEGAAQKGLIVRHLILPGQTEDSIFILDWMEENLPSSIALSLMSQYHPCFKSPPEIQRYVSRKEYFLVVNKAHKLRFETMFIQPQPFGIDEHLIPNFSRKNPFE